MCAIYDFLLFSATSTSNNDTYANVTYANAFCALCHGETDFEYWNAEISDPTACFKRMVEYYAEEFGRLDFRAWKRELLEGGCDIKVQ